MSRKRYTQPDLEKEAERRRFNRNESLDETLHKIVKSGLWILLGLSILFTLYGLVLYSIYLADNKAVSETSIEKIETIFTHALAIIGGYLAHVVKKSMDD